MTPGSGIELRLFGEDLPIASYCAVLGVRYGCSPEELRAAYRRRVTEYHPDKVAALGSELREVAERRTKEINEAYRALVQLQRNPARA